MKKGEFNFFALPRDTEARLIRIVQTVRLQTGQDLNDMDPLIYFCMLLAVYEPEIVRHILEKNMPSLNIRSMRVTLFAGGGYDVPDTDPLFASLAAVEEVCRMVSDEVMKSMDERKPEPAQSFISNPPQGTKIINILFAVVLPLLGIVSGIFIGKFI